MHLVGVKCQTEIAKSGALSKTGFSVFRSQKLVFVFFDAHDCLSHREKNDKLNVDASSGLLVYTKY